MDKTQSVELTKSAIKSIIGVIPYGGTALNEILFDYRSRVKQERLNNFTALLTVFFVDNPEIKIDSLKNEDFSDLFESVLRKVSQTKSKDKHKISRHINLTYTKSRTRN